MLKRLSLLLLGFVSLTASAYDVSQGYAGSKLLVSPTTVLVDQSGSAVSAANPQPAAIMQSGSAVSAANPLATYTLQGGSAVSATNPQAVYLLQSGSAVGATAPLSVQQTATPTAPPILQQDLIGNSHSWYPTKTRGFTFGRYTGVNNTRVDLWEGPTPTYVFPTGPMQMRVVSTSANDTANGTGVQQIHFVYLDNNYTVHTETVTLNGLTPVNTVATNILRVNAFHAIATGSGAVAAGNISLQNTAGTVTYGFILAGYNTARQAIYTIPAGVTGYINHWQTSSGSAGNHFCITDLQATTHDNQLWPTAFLLQDEAGTQNTPNEINFPIPIPIPAMADVKMTAICDASNASATVTGAIMGWFEP